MLPIAVRQRCLNSARFDVSRRKNGGVPATKDSVLRNSSEPWWWFMHPGTNSVFDAWLRHSEIWMDVPRDFFLISGKKKFEHIGSSEMHVYPVTYLSQINFCLAWNFQSECPRPKSTARLAFCLVHYVSTRVADDRQDGFCSWEWPIRRGKSKCMDTYAFERNIGRNVNSMLRRMDSSRRDLWFSMSVLLPSNTWEEMYAF